MAFGARPDALHGITNRATLSRIISVVLFSMILGNASAGDAALEKQCRDGLKIADEELESAKSKGASGAASLAEAASLLTAASFQAEFGKYPNCIDKVKRARKHIRDAAQGK